jgi:autotransporter-associated beta strand protein
LGYATALYKREADVPSEEAKVEYAWLLGGRDANNIPTEGRMCYTGTWPAQITNRPMALATSGAFATTQARIRLFDVRAKGVGAKTLALEAPAGITNDLYDIAGTENSPIGIVKRGEGTWCIGGNVSLGGPISVEGGELIVENRPSGSAYTWFKLTVKQTAATCLRYVNYNSTDRYVRISELGLFDKNGNRITLGIRQAETSLDVLQGMSQVAIDSPNSISFDKINSNTSCLFDNLKPDASGLYHGGMRALTKTQIRLDNPNTWASVVFRLTNGSPEAVSFDYVNPGTTKNDISWGHSFPTAMRLEASNDGVNWEMVWEDDELEIPEGLENEDSSKTYYKWASNGDAWTTTLKQRKYEDGKSFKLERTRQLRETSVLTLIPELSVAAGASLKVEGDTTVPMPVVCAVKVDGLAGAGAVQGIKFASSGVLNVVNCSFEGHSVTLPLGFANADGAENLSKWNLEIDGEIPSRLSVSVASDGSSLTISKIGMTIVVR